MKAWLIRRRRRDWRADDGAFTLMVLAFRLLGVNIREHHFSTEEDVERAAKAVGFEEVLLRNLRPFAGMGPLVYQVGHFRKPH